MTEPPYPCMELLEALDKIGREYNRYEYGLPLHDAESVEAMRKAVKDWVGND